MKTIKARVTYVLCRHEDRGEIPAFLVRYKGLGDWYNHMIVFDTEYRDQESIRWTNLNTLRSNVDDIEVIEHKWEINPKWFKKRLHRDALSLINTHLKKTNQSL